MSNLSSILYSNSKASSKMFVRSSTPKTPLSKMHLHRSSTAQRTPTSSLSLTNESPRCSTPLYPKQRRTRPFIACDLCRQRAMKDLKTTSTKHNKEKSHPVKQTQFISNSTSTVKMTKTSNIRRRCSALDQLLVWII